MRNVNAVLLLIRRSEAMSSASVQLYQEQLRLIERNLALRLTNQRLVTEIAEAGREFLDRMHESLTPEASILPLGSPDASLPGRT